MSCSASDSASSFLILSQPGRDRRPWHGIVAELARLSGLLSTPSVRLKGGVDALLAFAGATAEPVFVPPANPLAVSVPHERPLRVLVPTDRSAAVRAVVHPWIERFSAAGAHVEQIHVLDVHSRPAMWEGPGHHAAAWRAEVGRRHRVGTEAVVVRSGDPAHEIEAVAARFDLVLVCWKGDASVDRAGVLRQLLAGITRPVLLVRDPPPPRATEG